MLPVKRTTTAAALGVDSESSSLKKHRGLASAASGTAVTYTINMAGGSSNGSKTATNDKSPIGDGHTLEIDEDLHSRQLAVYGRETMRRLFASNILISGVQGLGAEIAKNLILAGVKSVTLHDEDSVELWDLSSSFIFSEEDLGKNRALASVAKLQELNNSVIISTLTTELAKEKLSDFQVYVNAPYKEKL
ncbi:hypothetical protein F511_29453 [Dorcoceras hygrometricum]|uniref:THIF-type NAD/FAD binding fold domain-containing protein n=1 Tax=Dorcoceras hygrometricum TaxID=472368 RepID=A0A2Z7A6N9_9LAMI|nr:hypothetical protein F511_29453 [Dorcoceras hygrometricum]